jgi:hypothetical protein
MAGSQATAGLRGGAVRDSGHHTNSELTRLGPASARWPGPHQGEGGFSPRVPDTAARRRGGAEEEDRGLGLLQEKQSSTTPSPAGPAPTPRWRLDHGRLLPPPGGSGSRANDIGIKAAGTRLDIGGAQVVRRPPQHPSGEEDGLTCSRANGRSVASRCRPGGDAAVQQRGGLGSSTAASSAPPSGYCASFSSSPSLLLLPWSSFFFLPESAAQAGACGLRLTPVGRHGPGAGAATWQPGGAASSFSPASCASFPSLPLSPCGGRGKSPMGGGAAQGEGLGRL